MVEGLAPIVVLVVIVALVVHSIRRRARMTPDQRTAEDQLRETRRLRRAMERRRYD